MFYTYKIVNMITGKFYIGSTTDWKRRMGEHMSQLFTDKHHNVHLQRAWNKDGMYSFKFCIISSGHNSFAEMIRVEQKLLDKYINTGILYNINDSAKHPPVSEKQKCAVSKIMKSRVGDKNPMYGKKRPDAAQRCLNRASDYKFISPDGVIYSGKNVSEFARNNNLNQRLLSSVLSGKRKSHKGWRKV